MDSNKVRIPTCGHEKVQTLVCGHKKCGLRFAAQLFKICSIDIVHLRGRHNELEVIYARGAAEDSPESLCQECDQQHDSLYSSFQRGVLGAISKQRTAANPNH